MKRLLVLPLLLALLLAGTAAAAGIAGKWKGKADTPAGPVERTFVFKVDGNKITGETSSDMFGNSTIENGKIDGDNLSFSITLKYQGNEVQANYKGKFDGERIHFSVDVPNAGSTVEYTVERVP
jgi:hypothetical protein